MVKQSCQCSAYKSIYRVGRNLKEALQSVFVLALWCKGWRSFSFKLLILLLMLFRCSNITLVFMKLPWKYKICIILSVYEAIYLVLHQVLIWRPLIFKKSLLAFKNCSSSVSTTNVIDYPIKHKRLRVWCSIWGKS